MSSLNDRLSRGASKMRPLKRSAFAFLLFLALLASLGATVADLNEAGKAAYARGEYAAAERLFSQAIAQAPREPLLHYHRAIALTRLGRWREASEAYEAVLRLTPPQALATAAREGLRALAPLTRAPASQAAGDQIQLRQALGGWVTEVVLNDTRTVRFLVDTGAAFCVITPELASELGIAADSRAPSIELHTGAGLISGPLITIPSVRVGEIEAKDVRAVVLVHAKGPGMEGILGNSFLARYVVNLDPERGLLELRPR